MKKIVIIGGGIAGLSAGIYAQLYGFESVIFEKHSIVGGQCTGWNRQGYHIDGCIQWLTGTKEGTDLNDVWKKVGALDDIEIIQLDNFGTYEFENTSITLWKDLDRLQSDLIAISQEDSNNIKALIHNIRVLQAMEMPAKMPIDMLPIRDLLKLGRSMKGISSIMKTQGKISCEEYANRFHHPALRKLFKNCIPKGYSIAAFMFSMATFSSGNGAIPKGGSKEMALRMKKRYLDLGGKLNTNMCVEEIVIENKLAKAVQLSNGRVEKGDYIIAACDTYVTFEKLLNGKYRDKKFDMRYQNERDYPLISSVIVAFGVEADLNNYPTSIVFEAKPYHVGVTDHNLIGIRNYAYESLFSPEGNTVITLIINQYDEDYFYWEKIYDDKESYNKEKQRIADELQIRIEERFPELKGKITLLDIATPMTYHRYTGAYHGAWMSFLTTPKSKLMMHSGKIKGLKNCYLTGQWLMPPGGLPVAVTTGKFTVQRICKEEKLI